MKIFQDYLIPCILNEEAYNALKQMYDDLYKNTKKRFLVTSAYKSYDVLNLEENTSQAGYSEFQIRNICFFKSKWDKRC